VRSYVAPKFAHLLPMSTPLGYIGRGPLASPAVGIQLLHQKEHEKLLHDAFHA
jgi:2-oxoglutarate dehydrogenase complex dehydrogenase (E1) component-like enzyme